MKRILAALALAGALHAQPLDPAKLLQPPTDSWPTYNGDYTGRRYSPLTQINQSNVGTLNLAWTRRFTAGGGRGGAGGVSIKATPLEVNGILYFSAPDNAWAVDARTGRRVVALHMADHRRPPHRQSRLRHVRRLAVFRNARLLSGFAEREDGKDALEHQIADVKQEYFCGACADGDQEPYHHRRGRRFVWICPGYLESYDPETGALQWRWNTQPRPGEPGCGDLARSKVHGAWRRHDLACPEHTIRSLNLYYFGTGNPNPVMRRQEPVGRQSVHMLASWR